MEVLCSVSVHCGGKVCSTVCNWKALAAGQYLHYSPAHYLFLSSGVLQLVTGISSAYSKGLTA